MSLRDHENSDLAKTPDAELTSFEWVASDAFNIEQVLDEILEGEPFEGPIDEAETAEAVEQLGHEEAAEAAQSAADVAIEEGDYAAAAEFRETAEAEAALAENDEMLHGSDAIELEAAAARQDEVEQLEWQESQHAQNGDYEAARDAAFEAEWTQREADSLAGGSDHSGQPQIEQDQMDWAIWNEEIAEDHASAAVDQLENGNLEAAENALDLAATHQEIADEHGDLGEHGGPMSLDDPFSETANDHGFDGAYDSTIESGWDSGFDSGWDASYDSGLDTGYDTLDSGSDF